MQNKLLHNSNGQRTFAVILETGEEVSTCLHEFVTRERVLAAQITAIGALSDVVLLYFDWDKKAYLKIPVREQVEVASLVGDVAEAPSGEPALHLHLVVGKRDGAAMAGHLGEAHVRPTLEVIVTESPHAPAQVQGSGNGLGPHPACGVNAPEIREHRIGTILARTYIHLARLTPSSRSVELPYCLWDNTTFPARTPRDGSRLAIAP
jgi:predicted DNA-binding protein with PD1-like motif